MREIVYMAGQFLGTTGDARVSLFDRGYLLGDAVFETLRAVDGVPWLIARHLDRLERGARVLALSLPEPRASIGARVVEAIDRLGARDATVRITLSRGPGPRGIGTAGYDAPGLSIVAAPREPYPAWAYTDGIDAQVVRARRIPPSCIDSTIKHANYLPQILARRELSGERTLEGVMCSVDGRVASGLVSNLFVVRQDRLATPSLDSGCLPGVTRAVVLELAAQLGVEVDETAIEPSALAAADQLFFTSTLMGCLPVRRLDGRVFADAPVTRRIAAELDQMRAELSR